MSGIYYSGLNPSGLFVDEFGVPNIIINEFTKVPFEGLTDMAIGWSYFVLWRDNKIYISGKLIDDSDEDKDFELLKIPTEAAVTTQALCRPSSITILTEDHEIWIYKIGSKTWKKVDRFIVQTEGSEKETVDKIYQSKAITYALTNFGNLYCIPTKVEMETDVKFVDVACGFDHAIMLTKSGQVYSMGIGLRGQLGHGDLENYEEPTLIEALAGLKVVQIAAGGWHSAVITDEGDLYTWGWSTKGELGLVNGEKNVCAYPTPVDFKNEKDEPLENIRVTKVRCGNAFTICMTDDGTLWGCGWNKYGQLGLPTTDLISSKTFRKLKIDTEGKPIKDFKCREWGTCIFT